jgi:hypothetical protein
MADMIRQQLDRKAASFKLGMNCISIFLRGKFITGPPAMGCHGNGRPKNTCE